jgi:hypothetical protein
MSLKEKAPKYKKNFSGKKYFLSHKLTTLMSE